MNITGYKQVYHRIKDTITKTENDLAKEKKKKDSNDKWIAGMLKKLEILKIAKGDCRDRIKELQIKRMGKDVYEAQRMRRIALKRSKK